MVNYAVYFTKEALKDAKKITSASLRQKVENLIEIISVNPFLNPPPYEKLIGDLEGAYSRRINIQHRLIYQVITKKKIIKIIRMWTHYE